MNAEKLRELVNDLEEFESLIEICKTKGGSIRITENSDNWCTLSKPIINTCKDELRKIFEKEVVIIRRLIKEEANRGQ